MSPPRTDRWQHLVAGAFALGEGPHASARNPEAAARYLESVLEVFPAAVDPLEDFEGYAVRRMAMVLLEALRQP